MEQAKMLVILERIRVGIRDEVKLNSSKEELKTIAHRVLRQITLITHDKEERTN